MTSRLCPALAVVCLVVLAPGNARALVLEKQDVATTLNRPVSTEQKLADLLSDDTDALRLIDTLADLLVEWEKPGSGKSKPDINELKRLLAALQKPVPELFLPGTMAPFYCYYVNDDKTHDGKTRDAQSLAKDPVGIDNVRCDSKIDAYAYAAYWMNHQNRCWKLLENMRFAKGFEFRSAVQEYLEYHQGKEACVRTSPPARCQLAYCGGADYGYGIAFRPSVEFAGAAGTGLGFQDHNNVSFSLAASLGARVFFLDDKVDVRLGFGIAALPIGDAPTDTSTERKSRSAFLISPGIGFFNGLFGLTGIFLIDPGGHDRAGKGIGLTLDVVAIKNLTGAK